MKDDVILGGVANLEVTDVGNHVGKERVAGWTLRSLEGGREGGRRLREWNGE